MMGAQSLMSQRPRREEVPAAPLLQVRYLCSSPLQNACLRTRYLHIKGSCTPCLGW